MTVRPHFPLIALALALLLISAAHQPVAAETEALVHLFVDWVSEACKRYLRSGGYLIANNSHGDAGLASCDPAFKLVAVVHRRTDSWSLSTDKLSEYFVPKSKSVPSEGPRSGSAACRGVVGDTC